MVTSVNTPYATLLVHQLVRLGVRDFYIAPGLRSAPISLAADSHPLTTCYVHGDERGLSFAALGAAKASNAPVAIVTTSGTAAANLLPAVVEAHMQKVPLIVLTADRPLSKIHCGENQTIQQHRLFGEYTHMSRFASFDSSLDPKAFATVLSEMVYSAHANSAPVHLNLHIDDPTDETLTMPISTSFKPKLTNSLDRSGHKELLQPVIDDIERYDHGWIIIGSNTSKEDAKAAYQLAEKLSWPLIADATSGAKMMSGSMNIRHMSLLAEIEVLKPLATPSMIIKCGDRITSKALNRYLQEASISSFVHLSDNIETNDPSFSVTLKLIGSPADTLYSICKEVSEKTLHQANRELVKINEKSHELIYEFFQESAISSEWSFFHALSAKKIKHHMFVGNSIAIRAFDSLFFPHESSDLSAFSNRGASGIDGLIATSVGIAQALKEPVLAILGDQSVLHDVSSLRMLANCPNLKLIIFNNNCGGIFYHRQLQASQEAFNKYFLDHQAVDIALLVKSFGLSWQHFTSPSSVIQYITQDTPTAQVLELKINAAESYDELQNLKSYLRESIQKTPLEKVKSFMTSYI